MAAQYFVWGLFIVAGVVSVLASVFDWNWFFTSQNARFIVENVGRKRARLFYGLLGLIMIAMVVFFVKSNN
jgi:hypothetical protein